MQQLQNESSRIFDSFKDQVEPRHLRRAATAMELKHNLPAEEPYNNQGPVSGFHLNENFEKKRMMRVKSLKR